MFTALSYHSSNMFSTCPGHRMKWKLEDLDPIRGQFFCLQGLQLFPSRYWTPSCRQPSLMRKCTTEFQSANISSLPESWLSYLRENFFLFYSYFAENHHQRQGFFFYSLSKYGHLCWVFGAELDSRILNFFKSSFLISFSLFQTLSVSLQN